MPRLIKCFTMVLFIMLANSLFAKETEASLRHKIGQMLLIGFDGKRINEQSAIVKIIEENNIGGVILFDYNDRDKNYDKNIESPKQVRKLNQDLQRVNAKANLKHRRLQLPLLISIDYEGGNITRLREQYGFPKTMSASSLGKANIEKARMNATLMAKTLKDMQFNLDFAPVLDVNVNKDNPIIAKVGRSFSEDPKVVTKLSLIFSKALLSQHIQCAYKHFPGHGSSTKDSHLGFVDVTKTWKAYELKPYQDVFKTSEACGVLMTAHIVNHHLDESGLPATLSYKILTGLLRHQLQFKGVIVTDDLQMKAIRDHFSLEKALVLAINAGADMLMFGNNLPADPMDPKTIIDIIASKVQTHEIPLARINEAYQRIIYLKRQISPEKW